MHSWLSAEPGARVSRPGHAGASEQLMSDGKLFRLSKDAVTELQVASAAMEQAMQTSIERQLEVSLGVKLSCRQ